jgi:hypothetical protein
MSSFENSTATAPPNDAMPAPDAVLPSKEHPTEVSPPAANAIMMAPPKFPKKAPFCGWLTPSPNNAVLSANRAMMLKLVAQRVKVQCSALTFPPIETTAEPPTEYRPM